jgi:hypothetical protein
VSDEDLPMTFLGNSAMSEATRPNKQPDGSTSTSQQLSSNQLGGSTSQSGSSSPDQQIPLIGSSLQNQLTGSKAQNESGDNVFKDVSLLHNQLGGLLQSLRGGVSTENLSNGSAISHQLSGNQSLRQPRGQSVADNNQQGSIGASFLKGLFGFSTNPIGKYRTLLKIFVKS